MNKTITKIRWENGGCLPTPLASIWILGKCNLGCKHCYEGRSKAQKQVLPKERVKLIMNKLAPFVNSFSFMGGEPTLHPDLPELCDYAQQLGKYTLLVSNGVAVDKSMVKSLRDKVDCVKLGMDGTTDNYHDMVRGKGAFAKTLRAWEAMTPHISTMCKFTLNAQNIENLPQIADFYQQLGAKRLILNGWLKVGRGANIWNKHFALSSRQRQTINEYVTRELKPRYNVFPISRSCSLDNGCKVMPARTFYVDSRGAVSPCIFSAGLGVGNILSPDTNVETLLMQVNKIRQAHNNLHEPHKQVQKKHEMVVMKPTTFMPELAMQACRH
ncbi:radical SAM protein [Patescibacteria group bacterium]|nr:radical SAM protein [Patescibacteria group bacterium]